ncbi:hypothetical protein Pmani_010235 [Petrolisthes manimaculis]|uniref:PiggyBac transposable element-derived protein domain-containing protein n=1 Tax=Petrolisthes manimaculis TaxID=1843537 RepID=A0AAE1UCX2_9EUCA|nr:hypothetical protein Pmani_010235 [Petrolisthes manimaculis]
MPKFNGSKIRLDNPSASDTNEDEIAAPARPEKRRIKRKGRKTDLFIQREKAGKIGAFKWRQKVWSSTPCKKTRPTDLPGPSTQVGPPPATDLPGPSTQVGPPPATDLPGPSTQVGPPPATDLPGPSTQVGPPPVTPPHRRICRSSTDPLHMPSDESDVDEPAAIDPDQPVVRRRRRERTVPPLVNFRTATVFSKSKYKWNCRPQSTSQKTPSRNILHIHPGPTDEARVADTPDKAFRLLFSDNILDEIVTWTNVRIEIEAAMYSKRSAAHNPVERQELLSYLGILLFSRCQRDNHLSVEEMWSVELGPPLYRSAMGQLRFEFLNRCLRFDDPATREMID